MEFFKNDGTQKRTTKNNLIIEPGDIVIVLKKATGDVEKLNSICGYYSGSKTPNAPKDLRETENFSDEILEGIKS